MTKLDELIEEVITDTKIKNPADIAAAVFGKLSEDSYEDVLRVTLKAYVSRYIVLRRVPDPIPADPTPVVEAPDDLLSDDVQKIVADDKKRKAVALGSRRIEVYKLQWKKKLEDRVYNGTEYKIFGDFTAEDLRAAADALRAQASAFQGKADYYDKLAEKIDGKKLSDFADDPLRTDK